MTIWKSFCPYLYIIRLKNHFILQKRNKFHNFAKNCQDNGKQYDVCRKNKELRVQSQMPQRKLAAALDIDTATYCKIEKGERKVRRDQVAILSQIFNIEESSLLTLWLADKVTDMVASEQEVAPNALSIAAEKLKQSI